MRDAFGVSLGYKSYPSVESHIDELYMDRITPPTLSAYVMSATRGEWSECVCGCIYIQTQIEGTVTHSLCSLFLPHNLPTHPLPVSKKKRKKMLLVWTFQTVVKVLLGYHNILFPQTEMLFQNGVGNKFT